MDWKQAMIEKLRKEAHENREKWGHVLTKAWDSDDWLCFMFDFDENTPYSQVLKELRELGKVLCSIIGRSR